MKLQELIEALEPFNPDAEMMIGLSVPDLFINVKASLTIGGNTEDPATCNEVRLVATAPSRLNANQ